MPWTVSRYRRWRRCSWGCCGSAGSRPSGRARRAAEPFGARRYCAFWRQLRHWQYCLLIRAGCPVLSNLAWGRHFAFNGRRISFNFMIVDRACPVQMGLRWHLRKFHWDGERAIDLHWLPFWWSETLSGLWGWRVEVVRIKSTSSRAPAQPDVSGLAKHVTYSSHATN